MRKWLVWLVLAALLALPALGLAEDAAEAQWETRIQDLAHKRIGVVTGGLQATMLPQMLPEAEFKEFNTVSDAAMALTQGKIDAFSTEESVLRAMQREGQAFVRIDEPFMVSQYGMLFGNGCDPQLPVEFNAFLAQIAADGTLARLQEKWFESGEVTEFLKAEDLTGGRGTLRFATASGQKPFSYISSGSFTGFDVELMIMFCQACEYRLDISDVTFGGILTGIEQGKYDMAGSGVTITAERQKSMQFSDPYYQEDVVMVVAGSKKRGLEDFEHATLGVIDGSLYAGFSRELFPEARIDSYPSFNDLFQCVKQGKIDGFLLDIPNFSAVQRTDKNLQYITVPGYSVEIGIAFGKNEKGARLQSQMNEYLAQIREDGTYDALWAQWCAETEPTNPPAVPEYPAGAEELQIVLDLSRKPFVYLLNNEYAGFEVDLMYRFCQAYNYRPVFESASWTAGVAGLKEGRYDVVSCGIYMTEERKESVNFCDPYVVADVIMVIYEQPEEAPGFWASLKESFVKTFIREDRWKLIVEGVVNTLIISFFAVLGGTALGFGLYLLARSRFRAVSGATKAFARVYGRLIAGTPTLVVLMILFYVIFGKTDIEGMTVAVIGFALTFGAFVYSHLKLCVEGIDRGQTEASYALGYTRGQTFFKIILPQSMKAFMPTYTGEVVGLIKATSVVGYIAVNDLTKMGDIIRSNTYEALFPLIAVAVIYFIITWGAAALLSLAQKKLDSRRRREKSILKGVVK